MDSAAPASTRAVAKWGRPDALLPAGDGHHPVVGDREAQVDESSGQGQVPPPTILAEPAQLLVEGATVLLDEVHQHVHPAGPDGTARDLASGHEGDPELAGPPPGRGDAGQ